MNSPYHQTNNIGMAESVADPVFGENIHVVRARPTMPLFTAANSAPRWRFRHLLEDMIPPMIIGQRFRVDQAARRKRFLRQDTGLVDPQPTMPLLTAENAAPPYLLGAESATMIRRRRFQLDRGDLRELRQTRGVFGACAGSDCESRLRLQAAKARIRQHHDRVQWQGRTWNRLRQHLRENGRIGDWRVYACATNRRLRRHLLFEARTGVKGDQAVFEGAGELSEDELAAAWHGQFERLHVEAGLPPPPMPPTQRGKVCRNSTAGDDEDWSRR